jgi:Zn-dependent peptidase ImmA (M78 family)
MEADYFAAALLMPEVPFRKEANRRDPGLTAVEILAKACETSLTATAIRYAGVTRDAVAVILSTGPSIDWRFMSEGLKEGKKLEWINKGTPVPSGTVTESFNALPENVRLGKKDSGDGRLNDWMGESASIALRRKSSSWTVRSHANGADLRIPNRAS